MTTYSADAARDVLAGLLETPDAVTLEEPLSVGSIIALAEQVRRARAERDEARARLQAVRQTVFPLLRTPGLIGDLARTIEAEANPQRHPAA